MKDQLPLFLPMRSEDFVDGISSVASAVGVSLSDSPAGPTTEKSAPAPRRASRSRSQEKAKGSTIIGTYGPTSFASSEPSGPLSAWVSRCMQQLAKGGSTECWLTWKASATPGMRSLFQLVPSTPRTAEIDSGGVLRIDPAYWRTVVSSESRQGVQDRSRGMKGEQISLTTQVKTLATETMLSASVDTAAWGTPAAQQAGGTPEAFLQRKVDSVARGHSMGISLTDLNLQAVATIQMGMMVSPTSMDGNRGSLPPRPHDTGIPLSQQAVLIAQFPTPNARDHFPAHTPEYIAEKKAQGHGMSNLSDIEALGMTPHGSSATTGKPAALGSLNPEFVAWMMMGHLGSEVLACAPEPMPKSRRSSRKASKPGSESSGPSET